MCSFIAIEKSLTRSFQCTWNYFNPHHVPQPSCWKHLKSVQLTGCLCCLEEHPFHWELKARTLNSIWSETSIELCYHNVLYAIMMCSILSWYVLYYHDVFYTIMMCSILSWCVLCYHDVLYAIMMCSMLSWCALYYHDVLYTIMMCSVLSRAYSVDVSVCFMLANMLILYY